MTHFRIYSTGWSARRTSALVAGITVATVLATACTAGSPRGALAEDKQILSTCDPAKPPASMVQIDGTGSGASETITTARMDAVESIVRRTAICSGHLKVLVFSSSSAGTITLFDAPLHLDGATDNARLKRVPALVSDVMAQIRKAYQPALEKMASRGSDITSQLRLASEWIGQLDGKFQLRLHLLTDGLQNLRVNLGARALSRQEASALAAQTEVPDLSGASVVIAGLGRVVGTAPASTLVEGLIAYYDAVCRKTGAAECRVVTDYATAR
jgi:hypothetical protein